MRPSTLVAALILGCGSHALAEDLPAIKQRGVLRVAAVPIATSPFLYDEAGSPAGFDWDILAGFCRLQGLRAQMDKPPSTDLLVPWLMEGRVDIVAGGFTDTPARRRDVAFSVEVLPQRHVVLTRKPAVAPVSLDELRRLKRVGTVKATSWLEGVKAAGLSASSVDDSLPLDPAAMAQTLRSGRVDAVVVGAVFATLVIRADPEVQAGLSLGEPGSNAYALHPEARELRKALDAYLTQLKQTPAWYGLVIRHFGKAAPEILKLTRPDAR